jgi:ADP-ribosylglycohydrolase
VTATRGDSGDARHGVGDVLLCVKNDGALRWRQAPYLRLVRLTGGSVGSRIYRQDDERKVVRMRLTPTQIDRASGVLLGQACGDALGVPYEFAPALAADQVPRMTGGGLGGYAPGEWSDDTQMAVCIAEVTATGSLPNSDAGMSRIADQFLRWLDSAPADIGAQTSTVLRATRQQAGGGDYVAMLDASRALHQRTGHTAGNGALMRTGIIGVARLESRDLTATAARAVAELTHWDPLAGDSCVLWTEAVRLAVTDGVLDLRSGLDLVPGPRRTSWARWIDQAEEREPAHFTRNGFTVTALQAAWSAIVHTDHRDGDPAHLVRALHAAIRIGHDTDTVAAITGALLGARYGVSAIPLGLRRTVHGWPHLGARDLVQLAYRTALQGHVTSGPGRPTDHHTALRVPQIDDLL